MIPSRVTRQYVSRKIPADRGDARYFALIRQKTCRRRDSGALQRFEMRADNITPEMRDRPSRQPFSGDR